MADTPPYKPALQVLHTLAPTRLYFPAGHTVAVALVEAAEHAYPALQGPLQLALGMADTVPYSPAAQSVHTPAPDKLYRPAAHTAAVPLVDPAMHAYPALQLASQDGVVRPDVDPNRPTAQGPLQLALGMADTAPYRPALQLVHTPALTRLYVPLGHTAAVALIDPATHAYPALQLPSHVGDVRPDTDPKRPASHGPLQVALGMADTAPYRPALQLLHILAPERLYVPGGHSNAVEFVDPAAHA
jgi:hypothetical protein